MDLLAGKTSIFSVEISKKFILLSHIFDNELVQSVECNIFRKEIQCMLTSKARKLMCVCESKTPIID